MTDYHRSSIIKQAHRRRQERYAGLPGVPLLWSRAMSMSLIEDQKKTSQPLRGVLAAVPLALAVWCVIGGLAFTLL